MGKFNVGDRVRCIKGYTTVQGSVQGSESFWPRAGSEYQILGVDDCDGMMVQIFMDRAPVWDQERFELIQHASIGEHMTEVIKVGDLVRVVDPGENNGLVYGQQFHICSVGREEYGNDGLYYGPNMRGFYKWRVEKITPVDGTAKKEHDGKSPF